MPSKAKPSKTRASVKTSCSHDDLLPPLPLEREELASYVRHNLTREERLVLMLRYAEQLNFKEIAGVLSMPQRDIERIHKSVVARLRQVLAEAEAQSGCLIGA